MSPSQLLPGLGVRPSDLPQQPIAYFDSGVGGLTVLEAIERACPGEGAYYIADQAHVPYGGRPLDEVRGFAERLTAHAFEAGAKLVVMACNISSATYAADAAERWGADRVLGVVDPGAAAALRTSLSGRLGVLATQGTVDSEAYPRAVHALGPKARVTQRACPRFVPLVEAGELTGPAAEDACREALEPLLSAAVDTVVLGCTHYPYLLPTLQSLAPHIGFIDPARETAERVAQLLEARGLRAEAPVPSTLYTTGDVVRFAEQVAELLPEHRYEVAALRWPHAA